MIRLKHWHRADSHMHVTSSIILYYVSCSEDVCLHYRTGNVRQAFYGSIFVLLEFGHLQVRNPGLQIL